MRCCDCEYHESGYLWNCCHLTGDEYYHEFYESPCAFINDDYEVIEDCQELGLVKGEKVLEQRSRYGK